MKLYSFTALTLYFYFFHFLLVLSIFTWFNGLVEFKRSWVYKDSLGFLLLMSPTTVLKKLFLFFNMLVTVSPVIEEEK